MNPHCQHTELQLDCSSHAGQTKYQRPSEDRRIAATQLSGRVPEDLVPYKTPESTFPGPLILPDDDLACDGKYPPQSVRSWSRELMRNEVSMDRRTIYVIGPPLLSDEVKLMQSWKDPKYPSLDVESRSKSKIASLKQDRIRHPELTDIMTYFQAFFHGMEVKTLERPWRFNTWSQTKSIRPQRKSAKEAISLETGDFAVRVRTRLSLDGCFERQVNLSDLLDGTIDAVPKDAYAVLLLIEQDMYEDETDQFCCGRAAGGSRVAVISTARYHPALDDEQFVDRVHAWPASHCSAYIRHCCDSNMTNRPKKKARGKLEITQAKSGDCKRASAMQAAVDTHTSLPSLAFEPSTEALEGLWLGRVCKTAAHEIGHCLGMDHCVYNACLMQGSANICEDARQPPFLCPIDSAKLTLATGADAIERYEALLAFCNEKQDIHIFAAFAAWLAVRLTDMKGLSC